MLIVLNRTCAVVAFGFMAANSAVGTEALRRVSDRNLPFAETRNFALDQLLLIGAMHPVTDLAGPALGRLVDMDKMQILIAITEVGQFAGARVEKSFSVVTFKTERIIFFLVPGVKLFGIIMAQQHAILRPVRIVTGPTSAIGNRFMLM